MRKALTITFLSDWRISSGMGDGVLADAMLTRDVNGIPYLPGRALKGALREGARRLGLCRPDLHDCEEHFWGSRSDSLESNVPGRITVSPGTLPRDIQHLLLASSERERELFVRDMTLVRSQTALDENGLAKSRSLRTLECGMPGMEFHALLEVHAPFEPDWLESYFRAVCAATKSMGGYRSRGLGSCEIRFSEDTRSPVVLPPLNDSVSTAGEARS